MADITRHGAEVSSVFDLIGTDENDLTASLGFALTKSPALLDAIVRRVWPEASSVGSDVGFALEVRAEDGRTDLEIRLGDALLIVEAKRGWLLPGVSQLRRYTRRISSDVGAGALISLSQASRELAAYHLPSEVGGVPVRHLPWVDVMADIAIASRGRRGQERLWLDEFHAYLQGVIRVRQPYDSRTYCVVINNELPAEGGQHTFREYVTDANTYFHPFGTLRWPTEPPNFLAFRWDGAVQRIHRVAHFEVVPTLREKYPTMSESPKTMSPHVIYDLGARLPPLEPIPNGAQYRASRIWVLLDLLQTSATLEAAHAASRALTAS